MKQNTVKNICKELGITKAAYYARKKRGWSELETNNTTKVGACYRLPNGTPIYSYLKSIGKKYYTFANLLNKGFTVEQALKLTINPIKRKPLLMKDNVSLRQYCLKNGLDYYKEWMKARKKTD